MTFQSIGPLWRLLSAGLSFVAAFSLVRSAFRVIGHGWRAGTLFALYFIGWLSFGFFGLFLVATVLGG